MRRSIELPKWNKRKTDYVNIEPSQIGGNNMNKKKEVKPNPSMIDNDLDFIEPKQESEKGLIGNLQIYFGIILYVLKMTFWI